MSQSSSQSRGLNRRVNSLQNEGRVSRDPSHSRRGPINYNDAYLYALRIAYLSYLLQPRKKRARHVPTVRPPAARSTSTFNDLIKDFSLGRDTKSVRLPHGFVAELDKRLTGMLMGREKRQEYQDALVKRTFAAFYNAFAEASFKKRMEKDRRVEDLVLIFFSNATKELQKGKPAGDEGVKMMVDRHVALFIRLFSIILKDHDWVKEKSELASKLATMETKLLSHDQDLSHADGEGTMIEEIVPLSYEVKDMPLVQVVARIFGLTHAMVQSDVSKNKHVWTDRAALQDLKTYQMHLTLGTRKTLRNNDFDLEESYEAWKKAEAPELSQMILSIIQANPDLAKSAPVGQGHQSVHAPNGTGSSDSTYSELSKTLSLDLENSPAYGLDIPVDVTTLNISDDGSSDRSDDAESIFNFIPSDPRAMYRFIVSAVFAHDIRESKSDGQEPPSVVLPSKQSMDLLNEICLWWRVPLSSRAVLFLDVVREKYVEQEVSLDTIDAAFVLVKETPFANKRSSTIVASPLLERNRWTVTDFALMQQLLSGLYDAFQRDLYEAMMKCYDNKPSPLLGSILYVVDTHIKNDPAFNPNPEQNAQFSAQIEEGLANQAREIYGGFLDKEIPQEQETWEFYHVMQLGRSVLKLSEKIQKRYKKNPEMLGVKPLDILLENTLPPYAEDAKAMVERIIQGAQEKSSEVPIQDGFDLYQELSRFRRVYAEALPNTAFPFPIEETLADFVWRWIRATEKQIIGWVENAVKQDDFKVRTEEPNQNPTQDQRHSDSVIDIFRSFNQLADQVSQLNWDDDVGYAKFMTALSKSIGHGVTRYCELVEQMFSKEMDRLTPEQELAMTQTRQEKWMQLAKDTWNNKERIEPFHFYAQSFVKLNDIAFALNNWDKLEREVNVDACAEVIRRVEPPVTQRARAVTNYVFTIKIVEGEDLKACDINGFSDPYVVLTDEYQKRLSKTRIIYRNLNPRWDESIDITTQGPLNVIATIWDWDALGDHDYVGRTSLKLDPAHFGDFLPREYWMDLDTQGRLLLRVSMEGERDDIQFYFGKTFRTLKRTERDMTRKITDKLSAYINHCLSRRALRSLLSRGITISSVSSYFARNRATAPPPTFVPADADVLHALQPLFRYFDDNFAIMNQTLTSEAMIKVMTRLWKEVLVTIESMLVPALSDKVSNQRPLTQQELDIVFKWLQSLFDFFHAIDEETGEANGVPMNVLKSPKYHEIQTLNFFYFETTDNLIRISERMASATAARQQANRNRLSAPPTLGMGGFGASRNLIGMPSQRRAKSIMLSRNLGTMKKAKEEKWKEAQADPNDDMILRILRMRPEASTYLRDRSRQKERLAAAAAADQIVRQSLLAGTGGRMAGTLGRR